MKRIAIALLLLASTLGAASGADSTNGPQSIPELQRAIEAILKETRTPGAGIAIVSRDKVEWVAGLGIADVAANKPATAETLFRVGSVSKAFSALAALKLQEEDKLKLTDTVKQWVPEVAFSNPWEATNPVRLVHLMEHTTGFYDLHLREYALNDPTPISLKDALAYDVETRVSRWPPGSRMAYCNAGPGVLAAVVEKVSGKRFEDYVQEQFFNPLHMDTASFFLTPEVERRMTTLYRSDGITPYPYWHLSFRSAGALNASARDMANYVRFYLQRGSFDGAQLLQPASIERMERAETLPSARLGEIAGYGLYNYTTCEGPFVFHGHGGGVMGGVTDMAYLPSYGRGYALMMNTANGNGLSRIGKLIRTYLTRDLTAPALPPAESIPAEVRQHYGGYYQMISPRYQWLYPFERLIRIEKLTFTANGLSTTLAGVRRDRWAATSDRLFRKENQSVASLALLPDAGGEVLIEVHWGTYKKVSALRVWAQIAGMVLVSLLISSSLLFAPVWVLRKVFGKPHNTGPLLVRAMPLISAALLVIFDGLLLIGLSGLVTGTHSDDLFSLGTPSALSVGVMLSSIGFAFTAAASLYVVYRERAAVMNRAVYWHSVSVALAVAAVAVYYGYWGLIGLRLWA